MSTLKHFKALIPLYRYWQLGVGDHLWPATLTHAQFVVWDYLQEHGMLPTLADARKERIQYTREQLLERPALRVNDSLLAHAFLGLRVHALIPILTPLPDAPIFSELSDHAQQQTRAILSWKLPPGTIHIPSNPLSAGTYSYHIRCTLQEAGQWWDPVAALASVLRWEGKYRRRMRWQDPIDPRDYYVAEDDQVGARVVREAYGLVWLWKGRRLAERVHADQTLRALWYLCLEEP